MEAISATDLANGAAKYLKRAEGGESFEVTSRGRAVARILPPVEKERPVPWKRSPSAGTPGSPVAADGRRHIRDFPCPARGHYRLSDDRRMWLEDHPPPNLKIVDRVLNTAFPQKRRY